MEKKYKVALVAPQFEAIPPVGYGGIELVVANIAEGLMAKGHDVTVYASGDSKTKAKLKAVAPKALWKSKSDYAHTYFRVLELDIVYKDQQQYDIIHNHIDYNLFILTRFLKTPVVTTFHGRFNDANNYVSISNDQRRGVEDLNWIDTVYNGIDTNLYSLAKNPSRDYLLWIGRANKIKGPDLAIKIAKKFGMKLKLVTRIKEDEKEFFNKELKPHIDGKNVEFYGEISLKEKVKLYQNAYATLMPNRWREPFGLVMIESLACGAPIVGTKLGSIPEIVKEGQVGFMGKSADDMVIKLKGIDKINTNTCRERVNFSVKSNLSK